MENGEKPTWTTSLHPDDTSGALQAMKALALDQQRAVAGEAIVNCGRMLASDGMDASGARLAEYFGEPSAAADAVYDDPAVRAWLAFLDRAIQRGDPREIQKHCRNLPGVIERTMRRLNSETVHSVGDTAIAFQQYDLDPYIMAVTPPSYDFVTALQAGEANGPGCNFELQADLVATAIETIGRIWPELRAEIESFVRIVGYLPDASFRSCSAARYTGTVYLGSMDGSLLDIEESLVHETGHQILYRIAELTPLTRPGTPLAADYTLPWSGSQRDLFGFLHAFYIYALLVKYFWRRAADGDRYASDARRRAVLILAGIRLAEPMLASAENLTGQAQAIVAALVADMDVIEEEMHAAANRIKEEQDAGEAA